MIHVLYIDDEPHNLSAFQADFRRDFRVHTTTEPTDAVAMLREHPIEVLISDQKMPNISGVEFFELIMNDYPDPVRMLLTGHADLDAVIDAINKGQIYKYISKPWNEVQLADLIREAAHLHHQRRRERRAAGALATLIDSARGINRELLELVRPGSQPDAAAWARIAELAERIECTLSEPEL